MVGLATETDLERLRQMALLLEAENTRLHHRLVELTRALAQARHEPPEPVETLPQIRRGGIGPHAERPRAADHASARRSAVAVATSRPSTR